MEKTLQEVQKELDYKKYYQSYTARMDLAGNMEYCHGCEYRNENKTCKLCHNCRTLTNSCAKNWQNLMPKPQKPEEQPKPRTTTTRKRKNG